MTQTGQSSCIVKKVIGTDNKRSESEREVKGYVWVDVWQEGVMLFKGHWAAETLLIGFEGIC